MARRAMGSFFCMYFPAKKTHFMLEYPEEMMYDKFILIRNYGANARRHPFEQKAVCP
jgi:hypothetical protein